MATRGVAILAVLALMAAPALADENESSEISLPRLDSSGATATMLPRSVAPETEALAVPEPEWTPIAPVSGCRREKQDTVYLTN